MCWCWPCNYFFWLALLDMLNSSVIWNNNNHCGCYSLSDWWENQVGATSGPLFTAHTLMSDLHTSYHQTIWSYIQGRGMGGSHCWPFMYSFESDILTIWSYIQVENTIHHSLGCAVFNILTWTDLKRRSLSATQLTAPNASLSGSFWVSKPPKAPQLFRADRTTLAYFEFNTMSMQTTGRLL